METWLMIKQADIHTGNKTGSSPNDAGQAGWQYVEEPK